MDLTSNPFARIVVGYDDSNLADAALRQSIALAEQYGGEIVAVHVGDYSAATVLSVPTNAAAFAFDPNPVLRSLQSYERNLFEKLSYSVARCAVPVTMEFLTNAPAVGILDAASRWNATAIAVGTHARTGVSRVVIGSVADEVLRSANVAVIVTREGATRNSVQRVLVAIESSEPASNANAFAIRLGLEHDVRLLLCTVSDAASLTQANADLSFDPTRVRFEQRASANNALDAALHYANGFNVFPETELIDASDVGAGLCEAARRYDADVIVIGSHKRHNFERLFVGSTAKAVTLGTDRAVIVVPGTGVLHLRRLAASERVSNLNHDLATGISLPS